MTRYLAHRLRQLVDPSEPMVELGAGFGSLALLARRAGFRDDTIVDLPVGNALQTFLLASALGPEAVSDYGEAARPFRALLSPSFADLPDRGVALVLNVESMPERTRDAAIDTLKGIRRLASVPLGQSGVTSPNPMLDRNRTVVPDLVAKLGGFKRIYRFPYRMMEGYVEELYRVVG